MFGGDIVCVCHVLVSVLRENLRCAAYSRAELAARSFAVAARIRYSRARS